MRIDEVQAHTPFEITDYWGSDPAFQQALARQFGQSSDGQRLWPELSKRLADFSRNVQHEVRPIAELCSRPNTAPRLIQFDEWGRRVDRVETGEGWRGLLEWQSRVGIVGESYNVQGQEGVLENGDISAGGRKRLGDLARLYNFARIFIFSPDCHVALCPTSMTDGAVRVLELYGTDAQKKLYMPKLLTRNFDDAWLAGQWMTEVAGGSDVSMTETVAERLTPCPAGQKPKAGDLYAVRGFKWFSSAADGNMSLALARTDADRSKGSKGLSLFLIPLHKKDRPTLPHGVNYVDETAPSSKYNGIKIHRLKNKLGTQHVPTAELELCGAVAELIGEEGRGVAQIAQVLNLTRMYSANGSVSSIGRSLHILQSYSNKRSVGVHGQAMLLKDIALHNTLVAKIAVTYRALLQLHCNNTRLLGKSEMGTSTREEELRLRLLTPVGKAYGALRASECIAQAIECMGGQGYMQENPLTTIFRDDFVGRIWEGTPSVLSLDVARVHSQTKGLAVGSWLKDSGESLQSAYSQLTAASLGAGLQQTLDQTASTLRDTLIEMEKVFISGKALLSKSDDMRPARPLLELLGIVEGGVQLLNQAAWATQKPSMIESDPRIDVQVAARWICGPEGGLAQVRATLQALISDQLKSQTESDIAYNARSTLDSTLVQQAAQGAGLMRGTRSVSEVSYATRPKL
jgi:alkylation response protein AidB-like acyl-CoA dehydrogenase